ncbi:LacI family DNA-binding transcriptional regulator [Rathayibacter sp. AY1A3]|uniref:LacI family DNA-binding transcriptional regulator n=1 Tax=Rathayibacter sp. AY1A3 TaxID=2080521 RepID=UPI000CE91552|nr:LacI family DNA-binding transcriptional regulator [Rathayibacter sp. AY1A3]PPF30836.1 LacI family transcriptional regulator [Rathayibacter sp. AY1A3]
MQDQRTSLRDVALAAGVSVGTASSALAGTGRVSDATRERVKRVAQTLDYAPHAGARNLRRSRAGSIGLVLPRIDAEDSFYLEFAMGAAEWAATQGVAVSIITGAMLDDIPRLPVDAFLVPDVDVDSPRLAELVADRRPVVTADTVPDGAPTPSAVVAIDHGAGIRSLLDHLVERGATRPALLAPMTTVMWGRRLCAASASWFEERSIPDLSETLLPGSSDETVLLAARRLAAAGADAIVGVPMGSAEPLVRAFAEQREGRPLIAGYVDHAALRAAGVTAVDLRPREVGAACARLAVSATNSPGAVAAPSVLSIAPVLVPRSSTQR